MKKLIAMLLMVTLVVSLSGCSTDESELNDPEVATIHGIFVIDVTNENEMVGYADHVFVAYINEETSVTYKGPISPEKENGEVVEVNIPYTNFSVTVIQNIKGELMTDKEIPVQKDGGLTKDGEFLVVWDHDVIPVPGNYYILLANVQKDGSLLVSGPYSTIPVDGKSEADIANSDVLAKYQDAFVNQVLYKDGLREQYVSPYSVK